MDGPQTDQSQIKQLALRMRNNNIQSSIERVIDVVKQELQQRGSAIEYWQNSLWRITTYIFRNTQTRQRLYI